MGFFDFLNRWAEDAKVNAQRKKLESENRNKARKEEHDRQRLVAAFEFEKPQLLRIISESVEIIKNTKNFKTALSRFDLVRNHFGRLLALDPSGSPLHISVVQWVSPREVTTHSEIMVCMETAKKNYTREFFKQKANSELLKADGLSDGKLKKAQLKKALKAALDGLVYLPNDDEMKNFVLTIEAKVVGA
jgi:hypothetical protein